MERLGGGVHEKNIKDAGFARLGRGVSSKKGNAGKGASRNSQLAALQEQGKSLFHLLAAGGYHPVSGIEGDKNKGRPRRSKRREGCRLKRQARDGGEKKGEPFD